MTHICVSKLPIIGSDNGLSPGRRQAIIRTNAEILLIRSLGTYFSEIWSEIHTFSFNKMHLKMSSGKRRPFCLGLNVLMVVNVCLAPRHLQPPFWPAVVGTKSSHLSVLTPDEQLSVYQMIVRTEFYRSNGVYEGWRIEMDYKRDRVVIVDCACLLAINCRTSEELSGCI